MKKKGIINPQLAALVASLGHGDMLLVADRGVPFPKDNGTVCIDLSLKPGVPGTIDVLEVVLDELEVESVIIAHETKETNPDLYRRMKETLDKTKHQGNPIVEENIGYRDFKTLWITGKTINKDAIDLVGRQVKGVVRTGECSPHGYIMLVAGVTF